MSFLSKIKENREQTSGLANPAQWLVNMFNPNSTSGQTVTEENAMSHSAVYSCVRVIAETIASLPLHVYREDSEGIKKKAKNNYLYPLVHNKPNRIMNSFTFRETMLAHLLLWGNHYSQLEIDNSGKVIGIWPLLPSRMQVKERNRRLYYIYYPKNGSRITYDSSEILHIPGLGFNGRVGKSVIKMAKEAIGLGLSAEEYGARFFSQGAQPGGIIEYPGKMSDEAYERYKKDVNKKYTGLGNSHKIMVLEEDLKYTQTGIPPDDAQFLETRKFQKNEIAMIYRVPPHMLGDMEGGASYSSIEQQSINFVVNTIRPWLVRIEQSLNDQLISSRNTSNYIKFVVEGLLRGDSESRASFYKEMFQIGAMSPNDIREKEDMNPKDGGDQSFVPLNMIPLDTPNPKTETNKIRKVDKAVEIRARRNAQKRINIRERYERLVKKSADKIVEREVNKLRDVLNKELKSEQRNEQNFRDEIVEFYNNKFPAEIRDEIQPVLRSLADATAEEVANEVGLDDYSIDEFFEKYMDSMTNGYAGYSRGQILALMNEAGDIEEATELVDERLNEWSDKKADKTAEKQSVKVEGAVSRNVYASAGVSELMWIASSDACPICQEMDGKIVGIEQSFAEEGDEITSDFQAGGPKLHPPLHEGCVCGIGQA